MSLPEYADGFRDDCPLTPEDVWPAGRSPLDAMDQQEMSIFAAAFTTQRTSVPGPARPGHRANADPEDEAGIFRQAFD